MPRVSGSTYRGGAMPVVRNATIIPVHSTFQQCAGVPEPNLRCRVTRVRPLKSRGLALSPTDVARSQGPSLAPRALRLSSCHGLATEGYPRGLHPSSLCCAYLSLRRSLSARPAVLLPRGLGRPLAAPAPACAPAVCCPASTCSSATCSTSGRATSARSSACCATTALNQRREDTS